MPSMLVQRLIDVSDYLACLWIGNELAVAVAPPVYDLNDVHPPLSTSRVTVALLLLHKWSPLAWRPRLQGDALMCLDCVGNDDRHMPRR